LPEERSRCIASLKVKVARRGRQDGHARRTLLSTRARFLSFHRQEEACLILQQQRDKDSLAEMKSDIQMRRTLTILIDCLINICISPQTRHSCSAVGLRSITSSISQRVCHSRIPTSKPDYEYTPPQSTQAPITTRPPTKPRPSPSTLMAFPADAARVTVVPGAVGVAGALMTEVLPRIDVGAASG
jgi:hypothetical protein